jgi:retron-type reverse transcriptase
VSKSDPKVKSFEISKGLVWEAYKRVKAKKGAAGVDGQSIEDFEADLKNNLYKIWNRMSSGTYFPPRCGQWRYRSHTVGERGC